MICEWGKHHIPKNYSTSYNLWKNVYYNQLIILYSIFKKDIDYYFPLLGKKNFFNEFTFLIYNTSSKYVYTEDVLKLIDDT